jgi:hypothetical protein
VSLRARGDREVFVFVVSFFEPAQGTLSLLLPAADYVATDALSGETVDFTRNGDRYEVGLDLPAFGSQVLRLQARAGKPLARW